MEKHVEGLSKDLEELLSQHSNLNYDQDKSRIRCSLSGHEMSCDVGAVNSYLNGKKFKKLQTIEEFDYKKYEPHIVPSKKKQYLHQLFCTLTLRHINKTPAHVERHVSGGKYKRALARWEECQRNGTVYKPHRGRKKQQDEPLSRKGKNETTDDDDGWETDTDSLSDLYPAMDFQLSDNEEGAVGINTMEVDGAAKSSGHDAAESGIKRKAQKPKNKQHQKKILTSLKKKQKVG